MEIRLLKDMFGRSIGENVSVSTDRAYRLMANGSAAQDKGFMALYEEANPKPEPAKDEPKPEPETKVKPKGKK